MVQSLSVPQFPSYLQRVNSDSKTTRSSYFLLFPSIPTVITRSQEEGNHQAKAITHISLASRPRDTEQKLLSLTPFPHTTLTQGLRQQRAQSCPKLKEAPPSELRDEPHPPAGPQGTHLPSQQPLQSLQAALHLTAVTQQRGR